MANSIQTTGRIIIDPDQNQRRLPVAEATGTASLIPSTLIDGYYRGSATVSLLFLRAENTNYVVSAYSLLKSDVSRIRRQIPHTIVDSSGAVTSMVHLHVSGSQGRDLYLDLTFNVESTTQGNSTDGWYRVYYSIYSTKFTDDHIFNT